MHSHTYPYEIIFYLALSGQCCRADLNPDLQIFAVRELDKHLVVNVERLPDYVSYPVYTFNYQPVVLLKHIVAPPKN